MIFIYIYIEILLESFPNFSISNWISLSSSSSTFTNKGISAFTIRIPTSYFLITMFPEIWFAFWTTISFESKLLKNMSSIVFFWVFLKRRSNKIFDFLLFLGKIFTLAVMALMVFTSSMVSSKCCYMMFDFK